ncbi:hypothetical protein SVAN01_06636 [Stagonosporopsis vannaccii]|nr:hypothetical protein SVAN01_06636 [Stagonosporopsis vannaccii]
MDRGLARPVMVWQAMDNPGCTTEIQPSSNVTKPGTSRARAIPTLAGEPTPSKCRPHSKISPRAMHADGPEKIRSAPCVPSHSLHGPAHASELRMREPRASRWSGYSGLQVQQLGEDLDAACRSEFKPEGMLMLDSSSVSEIAAKHSSAYLDRVSWDQKQAGAGCSLKLPFQNTSKTGLGRDPALVQRATGPIAQLMIGMSDATLTATLTSFSDISISCSGRV